MQKSNQAPFKVCLRIRPLPDTRNQPIELYVQNNTIMLQDYRSSIKKDYQFQFDEIFTQSDSNLKVYQQAVSPLLQSILQGYHATCFAYGMTGAGKTHTMLGNSILSGDEPGCIQLLFRDCFQLIDQGACMLNLSYLEIYNEHIKDLLGNQSDLMILEDPIRGIVVPGLTEIQVKTLEEVQSLILKGNKQRKMAPTGANNFSTRSHGVLLVSVEQYNIQQDYHSLHSKLSLIDLAGSERAANTNNRGQRMIEGANINRSLLALANCINILGNPKKSGKFVPYRDSKLTRLLKDSLGGNTITVMLACISPTSNALDETINTLKYADRAQNISKKVTRNTKLITDSVSDYKEIIKSLKSEIDYLKSQMRNQGPSLGAQIEEEITSTQAERIVLEEEIRTKGKEIDELYSIKGVNAEEISQKLLLNLDQHLELKLNVREIESLNNENQIKIQAFTDDLQVALENQQVELAESLRNEIQDIQENIKENEDMQNELLEQLYQNIREKSELQRTFSALSYDKRKELLELQIALRNLKLEKLDLHVQNINYKQQFLQVQNKLQEKENIIQNLNAKVSELTEQLSDQQKTLNLYKASRTISDQSQFSTFQEPSKRKTSMSSLSKLAPCSPSPRRLNLLSEARKVRKQQKSCQPEEIVNTFLDSFIPVSAKDIEEEDAKPNIPRSMNINNNRNRSKSHIKQFAPEVIATIQTNVSQQKIQRPPSKKRQLDRSQNSKRSNVNSSLQSTRRQQTAKLQNYLNTRILTPEEAAEIAQQTLAARKRGRGDKSTPSVTITLGKQMQIFIYSYNNKLNLLQQPQHLLLRQKANFGRMSVLDFVKLEGKVSIEQARDFELQAWFGAVPISKVPHLQTCHLIQEVLMQTYSAVPMVWEGRGLIGFALLIAQGVRMPAYSAEWVHCFSILLARVFLIDFQQGVLSRVEEELELSQLRSLEAELAGELLRQEVWIPQDQGPISQLPQQNIVQAKPQAQQILFKEQAFHFPPHGVFELPIPYSHRCQPIDLQRIQQRLDQPFIL